MRASPAAKRARHNAYGADDQPSQTDNWGYDPTPPRAGGLAAAADDPQLVLPALKNKKDILDRVHGQITMPGLLVAIMDTPEFQRLNDIKQLGGCSHVYPSAVHTRKEHSIGTAHLAGTMVRHLRTVQRHELEIDDADVLCVEMAGLLHDIGHGPFSHMFEEFMRGEGRGGVWANVEEGEGDTEGAGDGHESQESRDSQGEPRALCVVKERGNKMVRLQRLRPPPGADREINVTEGEYAKMAQFHFEHEEMSIQMVKMLFERNGIVISRYLEQEGDANRASDAQHIHFVCQLIRGIKDDAPWPEEATGRPAAKRFLADIVSNSRSGIDVDKLDYLVRDSMSAFGSSNLPCFDVLRIIKSAKVLDRRGAAAAADGGGEPQPEVCFQKKVALDINQVYVLRTTMHRAVYQHRIACIAEVMITDILEAADAHLQLADSEAGGPITLSQAAMRPETFVQLTDAVLEVVGMVHSPRMAAAKELLRRFKSRDYYKAVCAQVSIPTKPLCACGHPTSVEQLHCHVCGEKTVGRAKVRTGKKGPGGQPIYKAEALGKPAMAIRDEILRKFPELDPPRDPPPKDDVKVFFINIEHGKSTWAADPHDPDVLWEVFEPLASVGFWNPKKLDGADEIERGTELNIPGILLPKEKSQRTMHVLLKKGEKDMEHALKEAVGKWTEEQGMGRSTASGIDNSVTPSPLRSEPGGGTPRSANGHRDALPPRGLSTVYEAAGAEMLPAGDDEDGGDVSQSLTQLSEER